MNNTSRDALLMAVNQAGFAVTEANLYLDTHPCDSQAIAYLKQMSQAYADARNAYEASMGRYVLKMQKIQSTGPGQMTRGHGKEAVINVDL
mgnify:CR=1 FL=1